MCFCCMYIYDNIYNKYYNTCDISMVVTKVFLSAHYLFVILSSSNNKGHSSVYVLTVIYGRYFSPFQMLRYFT